MSEHPQPPVSSAAKTPHPDEDRHGPHPSTEEPTAAPSLDDKLAVMAHKMTDAELRQTIEAIRGNPKRAGSRASRLNTAESLALAALMAEEARRVRA